MHRVMKRPRRCVPARFSMYGKITRCVDRETFWRCLTVSLRGATTGVRGCVSSCRLSLLASRNERGTDVQRKRIICANNIDKTLQKGTFFILFLEFTPLFYDFEWNYFAFGDVRIVCHLSHSLRNIQRARHAFRAQHAHGHHFLKGKKKAQTPNISTTESHPNHWECVTLLSIQ